jgi:hypothetical protein
MIMHCPFLLSRKLRISPSAHPKMGVKYLYGMCVLFHEITPVWNFGKTRRRMYVNRKR